ncbi:hypothetical protein EYC84_009762 [Monilinia fructicola]|uniref:Methyltransferase type 11 domain-containing protein n=1 Tax=Monilinia fructicola TaxID=38448 RepID=A0A5M9JC60_MONFR|nr:hypothetical protein EYC84_009762 [Monilinia fructicola]
MPLMWFTVLWLSITLRSYQLLSLKFSKTLKAGGTFIFSVEHPTFTAPRNPDWIDDAEGHKVWPLDSYLFEGSRTRNWLAEGVVKQHRTISTYITILLDAGFTLSAIDEWGPTEEQLKEYPDWTKARHRPPFLLVKVTKPVV